LTKLPHHAIANSSTACVNISKASSKILWLRFNLSWFRLIHHQSMPNMADRLSAGLEFCPIASGLRSHQQVLALRSGSLPQSR